MGLVSLMLKPLYPWGNSPWYPPTRRLGRPHTCCGCFKEKNLLSLPGKTHLFVCLSSPQTNHYNDYATASPAIEVSIQFYYSQNMWSNKIHTQWNSNNWLILLHLNNDSCLIYNIMSALGNTDSHKLALIRRVTTRWYTNINLYPTEAGIWISEF